MEVSDKELRKMLNAAWDEGRWRNSNTNASWFTTKNKEMTTRYRDVSKIIKAAEKARKDGRDGKTKNS